MRTPMDLFGWRGAYDFDARGLSDRTRLERLEYALLEAPSQHRDASSRAELEFALAECRALLQPESLAEAVREPERLRQRIGRMRRVATHYEGPIARLNRRYWWVPFSLSLLLMAWCWFLFPAGAGLVAASGLW